MKKFSLIVFFSFFFLTGFCQLKSSFKSIRLVNGDSLDFSQQDGSVYLNQTTGQFRFRENGVWKGLGSGGGGMTIDSARIYDSLSVLRDSVDDISNYVHGLSQDFWPLSGNFSTTGSQDVALGGLLGLYAGNNSGFFTSGGNGLTTLSNYYLDAPIIGFGSSWVSGSYQGIFIDTLGILFPSTGTQGLIALNTNPNTPGLQIYNSGVMNDSSAVNKFYADTHLGGETFTPPTAGNDGQSIEWDETAGEWVYYTPGGVSEAYVAESIDTARTYADDNFWPLSGNFSTLSSQTISTTGATQFVQDPAAEFSITRASGAANGIRLETSGTGNIRIISGSSNLQIRKSDIDSEINFGAASAIWEYGNVNRISLTSGGSFFRSQSSGRLFTLNDAVGHTFSTNADSTRIVITNTTSGGGSGADFNIIIYDSLIRFQNTDLVLQNAAGARGFNDDHFVTKAQLDSVAALITMDISPNSLGLNKAVFDYKLLLLLCGVFIMGYCTHRNGCKRV